MPIRFAIIDDYEVVVRGLAHMLTSVSDDFAVVELDSRVPVEDEVDIALYDTFAQTQAGGPHVAELIGNPRVGEVVVPQTSETESGVAVGDWPGRAEGLTAREAEVIALITQGLSNIEIAEKAILSINSIKSYIRSAYRK